MVDGIGGVTDPTPEELRELLLQTGLELIDERGLGLQPDAISYAKVFAHLDREYSVKVTRASVHERIWSNHDEFRREVLTEAIRHAANFPRVSRHTSLLVAQHRGAERLEPASENSIDDVARLQGAEAQEYVGSAPRFQRLQAVKAVALRFESSAQPEPLLEALSQYAEERLKWRRMATPAFTDGIGLRVNRDLVLSESEASDTFNIVLLELVVGQHLFAQADPQILADSIGLADNFLLEPLIPWTLTGLGLKALYQLLYEVDPDVAERSPRPLLASRDSSEELERSIQVIAAEDTGPERRSREELKRLILAAGVELLIQEGTALKSEAVGYTEVFKRLREKTGLVVHRSTVHKRFWDSHEDYQIEVLARAVGGDLDPAAEIGLMFERAQPDRSPDGAVDIARTVRSKIRKVATQSSAMQAASPLFRRRLFVMAALLGRSADSGLDGLRAAVRRTNRDRIEGVKRPFKAQVVDLGFEVRPQLDLSEAAALETFAQLAVFTGAGEVFDRAVGIKSASRKLKVFADDDDQSSEAWTPAGIAALAYFEMLFQPIENN